MDGASRPISRRVRFEILRRDGYACRYCGATAPDVPLTVDHVIPRALGGSDDPTNLVTACRDCNSGKASTSPDEHIVADVDAAALLFARAMERANEIRRAELGSLRRLYEIFDAQWASWTYVDASGGRCQVHRDHDWRSSLARFCEQGLTHRDLIEFIPVAMENRVDHTHRWRYFCGCCWKELSNRQEIARRLIEDGIV